MSLNVLVLKLTLFVFPLILPLFLSSCIVNGDIPTTLQGPFKPVTVPLDDRINYYRNPVDLPSSHPQLQKNVVGDHPQQISVSLSSNYDSLWISWVTGDYQIGEDITPVDASSISSVVRYGIVGSSTYYEAIGYSIVYNQLYPYKGLQNYTSGIIHHVRLTELEPSALYEYRCGDPSIPAISDLYYFRTMPVSSPKNYPSRIAVAGDLGLTYNTSTTLDYLLSNHPDLFLLVGGVSYADMYLTNGASSDCYSCSFSQTPIHETYQPRWDYWGRFMQPLVANVPTMVVGGKHEMELQAEDEIFAAYSSRFAFPSEESGSSFPLYYSINAGGIHFVVLSAYVPYDRASDQYVWLERDLYNVDRSTTPWLVATWYPSWYTTYRAHYKEAECMREEMEELLYAYTVDIVFNGRVHAYERSNRVYNYSLDPCAPIYITAGDGGCREAIAISHADDSGSCPEPYTTPDDDIGGYCAFNFTSGPAAGYFCWDQQPEYSAFRESSYGHGILEVKNETHALWSWHRNQDNYQVAADIIYIVRDPAKCLRSTSPRG